MRTTGLVVIAIVLSAPHRPTRAQPTAPTRPAVDVTRADLLATLKQAPADGVMDQQIRVVDIGTYNVAVGVLHRAAHARQTAISHAQVTEVYHIIDGAGTFVTGGEMLEPTPSPSDGNTVKVLVGPRSEERRVGKEGRARGARGD